MLVPVSCPLGNDIIHESTHNSTHDQLVAQVREPNGCNEGKSNRFKRQKRKIKPYWVRPCKTNSAAPVTAASTVPPMPKMVVDSEMAFQSSSNSLGQGESPVIGDSVPTKTVQSPAQDEIDSASRTEVDALKAKLREMTERCNALEREATVSSEKLLEVTYINNTEGSHKKVGRLMRGEVKKTRAKHARQEQVSNIPPTQAAATATATTTAAAMAAATATTTAATAAVTATTTATTTTTTATTTTTTDDCIPTTPPMDRDSPDDRISMPIMTTTANTHDSGCLGPSVAHENIETVGASSQHEKCTPPSRNSGTNDNNKVLQEQKTSGTINNKSQTSQVTSVIAENTTTPHTSHQEPPKRPTRRNQTTRSVLAVPTRMGTRSTSTPRTRSSKRKVYVESSKDRCNPNTKRRRTRK